MVPFHQERETHHQIKICEVTNYMKFTNGQWLLTEGVEIFSPKEVYFTRLETDKLIITAPTKPIKHRGDTLGGVNLAIEISAPETEVIRIKSYHHKGVIKAFPVFELNHSNKPLDYSDKDNLLTITSGSLKLVIDKANWSMKYYRDGMLLTVSNGNDYGYVKTNWRGHAYDKGDQESSFMRQGLSLGVAELVYGFGERFTPFVKNGQTIEIWNEDGGTSTYQSYKNIPFYLTNKGYGVFVNHPEAVSFEVASENVKKVSFSVQGEILDYFLINGPSMKEVSERYTNLTGRPAFPKPWTYGLWLSTSFTTSYDEKTVLGFIDGMIQRDIPLKVFHFDCFWMKDFHWSNFIWDELVFSDPKGMLKKIHEKGIKVCVWINPYIAQASELFDEGASKGYFIKKANGDVWQWDMWQPGMAIVDFTNPAASIWFQDKLGHLVDLGVDCFKTDFGERIPLDVVYHDGSDPKKMHNYYSYLYNKVVYELLDNKLGVGEATLFARSATVGCQKYPVHWGGDCWSDYGSMAESLRGGLSLTMSGFGFWSHDIGGFESTSSADVYKRWCAFGLLSSHSRLHGSTSYRVPWAYDEEAVTVLREFVKLKAKLMPYLYQTAKQSSAIGVPMMRSMVMEFTEDLNTHYLDRQYMLGDGILVAPIMNEEGIGECYLPKGTWTHLLSGKGYQGQKWIKEKYDYLSLPVFVRENTIIPFGAIDTDCDYQYEKDVDLRIYSLKDNCLCERVVLDKYGSEKVRLSLIRDKSRIKVSLIASAPCRLTFVNLKVSSDLEVTYEHDNSIIMINDPKRHQDFFVEIK